MSTAHQSAMVGACVTVSDMPLYASHNDLGTAVLLAAMEEAGVKRLVFASSMVVYGEGRYVCATHGHVVPGVRTRLAVPIADQVAVSVKRYKHLRMRVQSETSGERKVATGRAAPHADPVLIGMEEGRAALAHPLEGVLHVGNDRRKFRFGREPVINRHDNDPGADQLLQLLVDSFAPAHDERAPMNPDDNRAHLGVVQAMHVRLDLEVADAFVNVRRMCDSISVHTEFHWWSAGLVRAKISRLTGELIVERRQDFASVKSR
jgi:hypothetical protein